MMVEVQNWSECFFRPCDEIKRARFYFELEGRGFSKFSTPFWWEITTEHSNKWTAVKRILTKSKDIVARRQETWNRASITRWPNETFFSLFSIVIWFFFFFFFERSRLVKFYFPIDVKNIRNDVHSRVRMTSRWNYIASDRSRLGYCEHESIKPIK